MSPPAGGRWCDKRRRAGAWLILSAIFCCSGLWAAEVSVPELRARVTDLTGTLGRSEIMSLESTLEGFETRTGSQIAVLVISSTEPEAIEQYALRVAEQWQLGRRGIDDGALLLVALEDRKVRIEVGYGLEGALTDATSRRIISEAILPSFRSGDIAGGIESGVDRMVGVAEGEPLPEPRPSWSPSPSSGMRRVLPYLLILAVIVGGILRRVLGRFWGSLTNAGIVGAIVWLVSSLLIAALLAGLITFFIMLIGGARRGGGRWSNRPRGGGWSGGGFSTGGFSGGGFSGGGGSFGGGGASGSW